MQEILTGVTVFTAVVALLTAVILLARRRILPTGEATLTINDKRQFSAPVGRRLLTVLAENGLFLPSACGGRGTCGQCRITMAFPAPPLLPTEATHIRRSEAAAGIRLACQQVLRRDVALRLPESMLGATRWVCTLRSTRNVSTFIRELILELPPGARIDFAAGSYVLIECPPHELCFRDFEIAAEYRHEWQRFGLFDLVSKVPEPVTRAYSMANCPLESDQVRLNVRIATPPPQAPDAPPGRVSSWLFGLRPGDLVSVTGPFGDFLARDTDAEMVFIGGGAGMAPMRSHILDQLQRLQSTRRISFWYGARNLKEAYYVDEFDALARQHANFSWYLALSDPPKDGSWQGLCGFIHEVAYENYLKDHPAPEDCEYYLCGPPVMIDAVKRMLYDLGVDGDRVFYDDFGS
ncbi:MAG: NADH:ubiquinone reductase (Na(+)-transporting) subunit F [Gammaproteobacteria bacterium]|nr:NADH:ubiquinone reductase (Na(+)-transporting) subunit F [Gammaproteobacteria bacterium]MDH4254272.1 NADH:ubiquinone reductase (Na(+)-transporting) subunit F [Gammaproteobacteria bacterium]MDH5311118.1 NADH:ubiquinone reductase (Na(+)-transporting) subunit F [Gammaproteobacteria bacterium]